MGGSSPSESIALKMSPVLAGLPLMGFLITYSTAEETSFCQILGSPEFSLLYKEGDVMIGGAFSIHSKITQPQLSFTEKPTPLECSR